MSPVLRQALCDIRHQSGGLLVEGDVLASMGVANTLRSEDLAVHDGRWRLTPKGDALLGCTEHTDCLASPALARACWSERTKTPPPGEG